MHDVLLCIAPVAMHIGPGTAGCCGRLRWSATGWLPAAAVAAALPLAGAPLLAPIAAGLLASATAAMSSV